MRNERQNRGRRFFNPQSAIRNPRSKIRNPLVSIDPRILALIDELDRLRKDRTDHWQVPRVEGELLFQIALAGGAKVIVEAGTSYGFSGLFWGAALKLTGGRLHTIDLDPRKVESSRETFRRAGLEDVVTNHQGDALEVLPAVAKAEKSIDIAFLDAGDKRQTSRYFELVWPRVRPGGSVLTDNATTHRADLADFVRHVRSRPDAVSGEIPVGNGLEWTVKTGARARA
jgi:predicted O-methyltransferase YrrM